MRSTIRINPVVLTWKCEACKTCESTATAYTIPPTCLVCLTPMLSGSLAELHFEELEAVEGGSEYANIGEAKRPK